LLWLVRDDIAGDPTTGRRWVQRSLEKLQREMQSRGKRIGRNVIRRLLRKHDIAPKSNVKHLSPKEHPDRNLQFQYIKGQRRRFQSRQLPIISVDAKKKELIGPFKNPGQLWTRHAPEVYTYDFPGDAQGKAIPFGIYDPCRNQGYVYVQSDADTADFAVAAILRWWKSHGRRLYPNAKELLVLADGGGSNGHRPRRWKQQLQTRLCDPHGIAVTVCHYPPGASKWNPVEHRLFSQISQTWAGIPLTSLALILELIRTTKTKTGLNVHAEYIPGRFPLKRQVSAQEMASLRIHRHLVCPLWNYTILPRKTGK
jgi:hypothetical protein